MWSASSRIVTSTAPRSQWPWPMRSSSRPGQAMRTSMPPASACTCGFWPTPPKIVVVRHAERAGQRVDDGGDLVGQLTGRHQDQRARPLGLPLAVRRRQPGDQREAEGQGLAGAGAAAAEHVAAGEAVGQRRDLDRERRGDAAGGEHLDQRRGDAEGGEGGVGRQHGGDVADRHDDRRRDDVRGAGAGRAVLGGLVAGGAAAATAAAAGATGRSSRSPLGGRGGVAG